MNLHENSLLGRRVFFVNPPYHITNIIIPRLTSLEYEVYALDTYKKVKNILRKYPDSICFLNIDSDELNYNEWFNFAQSFEEDEILSTIFFGVISQKAPKLHRNNFMLNVQLPAGFIQYNADLDVLLTTLKAILDMNGAMGKRKYIRADCGKDARIYAEIDVNTKMVPLMIQNISSVGISCYCSEKQIPMFEEKSVHRAVLHLKNLIFKTSVIILMNREINGNYVLVMIFDQSVGFSNKNLLRDFIRNRIQTNLDSEFIGAPLDEEDYSKQRKTKNKEKILEETEIIFEELPEDISI